MSLDEQCREYSVIIDNGSGVIFQPMTEEYTYILTAKHVISEDDKDENGEYVLVDKNDIRIKEIDNIIIQDIYTHNSLDIAIIKINKIDKISPLKLFETISENNDKYHLYGFPEYKRKNEININDIDLKFNKINKYIMTFNNELRVKVEGVKGYSGGGVFLQKNNNTYLVGIEYAMKDLEEEAPLYRINVVDIKAFDEIIEQYSDELELLYPPYLNDFSLLLDNIFPLTNMDDYERGIIKDRLKRIAEQIKIKPIDIKKYFHKELLVEGQNISEFSNKELWVMYLEFIVISIFLDDCSPIHFSALKETYKKRKFLFAKADDWIELKKEILYSDLTKLQKGGTVIVCCDGNRKPDRCSIKTKTLANIGKGMMSEDMRIDNGIESPYLDFKFKHIHIVQKKMIDDNEESDVFDSLTAGNCERVIKDEIKKVLD